MRISDWSSDVCSSDLIDPNLTTRAWGTSLTVEQDLGFASLKSITAYRHSKFSYNFDPDGTTVPRIVVDNHQFDKQFTQELNLVSEGRSEEHTSELQSLMRISYAVFCLKKKKTTK